MTYKLDKNFEEKVYAGVLGKIIGVFIGCPFEGWSYDRKMKELGPINYYVNDRLDYPLPISDDDSPFLKGGAGLFVDNGTLVTEQIILN